MRGLKQDRSARIMTAGHALVQNIRRGHYELAVEAPVTRRVAVAFDELAWLICRQLSLSPVQQPRAHQTQQCPWVWLVLELKRHTAPPPTRTPGQAAGGPPTCRTLSGSSPPCPDLPHYRATSDQSSLPRRRRIRRASSSARRSSSPGAASSLHRHSPRVVAVQLGRVPLAGRAAPHLAGCLRVGQGQGVLHRAGPVALARAPERRRGCAQPPRQQHLHGPRHLVARADEGRHARGLVVQRRRPGRPGGRLHPAEDRPAAPAWGVVGTTADVYGAGR